MAAARRAFVVAAASVGALTALRANRSAADAHFFDPPTVRSGPYEGLYGRYYLPARYHDTITFMGIFPASVDAIAGVLPSDELFPAVLPGGQGAVAIVAFVHRVVTVDTPDDAPSRRMVPYGEVGVFALATFGGRAPRGVPLLSLPAPAAWQLAAFNLHLPVTSREAMVGGRAVYNAPKFVADMEFELGPTSRTVELTEGERDLLRMQLDRSGPVTNQRAPFIWFTSRHGHLMRTRTATHGRAQVALGARHGVLELGDHPVARDIAALDVSSRPVVVYQYLEHTMVLPAPEAVGRARPYDGYLGTDREFGRLAIRYPGAEVIDVYADGPVHQRLAERLY